MAAYKTKQRDVILAYFEQHPGENITAKDLISQIGQNVGEATIYRTLSRFTKEGLIHKTVRQDSEGTSYHYHPSQPEKSCFRLKCVNCGKQIRLDCGFAQNMEEHIHDEHAFSIDCSKTVIYGKCGECEARA